MKGSSCVGVVVIGRNEGERLKRCLLSILCQADKIVYVDSDSSDGSVEYARSQGVHVVQLDMSIPFSAGRARNEGVAYLRKKYSELKYIQFIDGDCELVAEWLNIAKNYLEHNPSYAIVAGQRCERNPEQTVYNRLCDIEWNTPIGDAAACGGDFLVRIAAFQQVTGFNPTVIAGEEPELCYRLREKGWLIYRFDHRMTLHDADITKFSQWWKRNVRCGHAFAQGVTLHGTDGQYYCVRDSLRIWLWAVIIPCSIVLLSVVITPMFLLLFCVYPVQLIKIAIVANQRINNWKNSFIYAFFNVLGKWPELIGQLLFIKRRVVGKKYSIIEYH